MGCRSRKICSCFIAEEARFNEELSAIAILTGVGTFEFLEGFNREELREHSFSINTITTYIHYQLRIPNNEVRWTKSGNYLLHVYDDDTGEPLITRRFTLG